MNVLDCILHKFVNRLPRIKFCIIIQGLDLTDLMKFSLLFYKQISKI